MKHSEPFWYYPLGLLVTVGPGFIFYHCLNKLTQTRRLKTLQIYYLTASVGEKSRQVWLDTLLRVSRGPKSRDGQPELSLEVLGNNLLPGSFVLLGEFISMWLWDWGPHFLVGCQLGIILHFLRRFLARGPSHLPNQHQWAQSSSCIRSLWPPFPTSFLPPARESALLQKGPCA